MVDHRKASLENILDRMMSKEYYVIENTILDSARDLQDKLHEHLNYMIELEKAGILFLSGPLHDRSAAPRGEGLTVIRATSFEDAERIAQQDPFVLAGYRESRVRRWVVNEGRVSLRVDLSDGHVALD